MAVAVDGACPGVSAVGRYLLEMDNKARLLGLGVGAMALSLLTALLTPEAFGPGNHGAVFAVWLQRASFWVGILCIAAHLLATVLEEHRVDR